MITKQPQIILNDPTLDELKEEAWHIYNDGGTYEEIFMCIEDSMKQIKASFKATESIKMYGQMLSPEDAMKQEIRIEEFTKRDFFKLIDKHISI